MTASARSQKMGSIPLATLQARVDYGYAIARTTYGTIGVRVWIYTGNYGDEMPEGGPEGGDGRMGGRRRRRL